MCRHRVARSSVGILVLVLGLSIDLRSAQSQDQDTIGIYFDDQGVNRATQTSTDWEWVLAWVVIKDMSASIRGFGASARIEGRLDYFCWNTLIGWQNIMCEPIWWLSCDPPRPAMEALAAVRMSFRVPSPADVVRFYIQPSGMPLPEFEHIAFYEANDPPPGGGTGTIITLTPSSGSFDLPVAVVNGDVVSTESTSWGAVKALYR